MLTITPATPMIPWVASGNREDTSPFPPHTAYTLLSPCFTGRRQGFQNVVSHCILRGSNSRGLRPLGLKSSALTTRPRMRVRNTSLGCRSAQKGWCSQSETRTHNLPVNSRARCRLRHPGTRMEELDPIKPQKGMIPPAGIEPATNRLKVERST